MEFPVTTSINETDLSNNLSEDGDDIFADAIHRDTQSIFFFFYCVTLKALKMISIAKIIGVLSAKVFSNGMIPYARNTFALVTH